MAYIGLDIGSSGCKAAVVSNKGELLAVAAQEYDYVIPCPGYVELNPEQMWNAVCKVLRELSPFAGEVGVMAVSSIGESFVMLDEHGHPLHNFITYADQRCEHIFPLIEEIINAERLYEIAALPPSQMHSLNKIVWLQREHPELMKHARRILFANDFFNYKLTGKGMVDFGTASKTMLFDVQSLDWSDEILTAFDIPREWFSPVMPSGTEIGCICTQLAMDLGLRSEIKVVLGCHDQVGSTLGGGIFSVGCTLVGEGTTESINSVVDASIWDYRDLLQERGICVEPFLERGKYILPLGHLTFGSCLKWYVNTLEGDHFAAADAQGKSIYQWLEERCAEETELVFLPYLSRVVTGNAQNGALGGFIGVTIGTERKEMYRAVIEGLNFESRRNYELLKSLGMGSGRLVVTGGFSRSRLAMQMKADVFEREIETLENPEAGITGLAIICAVACGDYKDYDEAITAFVHPQACFTPCRSYTDGFTRYCLLGDAVRSAYSRL